MNGVSGHSKLFILAKGNMLFGPYLVFGAHWEKIGDGDNICKLEPPSER